ncbi:MAG: phage portal protein [Gammaproteobacteria bacterium]
MGFIQKIRKFFNLSLSDPKAWNTGLWNLYGSNQIAGENVNEETALTYSAFWCAVLLKSGTIGSLPLHLMQKDGEGSRIADEIPLYRVMHDRWNPFVTAKVGRQTMEAHKLTWGNGYAEKVLNGYGEVTELWPIAPDRVKSINLVDNDLVYEIQVGNETKFLPRRQILHIHGLGYDGFVGYSVVSMARKTIGLGMAMETFGSNLFSQGINPGAIIKVNTMPKDSKAMREALSETYAGLGKTHRLMLLEDGMDFQRVGIPPEDSQFLESRQFQVPEIARWFNLPPHKLKDLSKSSFNNIEQEQISFVTDSILPDLIDNEQEYHLQLLSERQRYTQKLYFKHIVEGLLRADAKSRAEFYQIMLRNRVYTSNEVRGKEDMNPSPDPLADVLWTEANMVPLSKYDDFLNKKEQTQPKLTPQQNKLIEFHKTAGGKQCS